MDDFSESMRDLALKNYNYTFSVFDQVDSWLHNYKHSREHQPRLVYRRAHKKTAIEMMHTMHIVVDHGIEINLDTKTFLICQF